MTEKKNMRERVLVIAVIFLLVLGCKFGSTTAQDGSNNENPRVDDRARTENVSTSNDAAPEATPKPAVQTANAVCPDPSMPSYLFV